MARHGMTTMVKGSIEAVSLPVADAFKAQGFGKALKEKVDAEFEPYLILGACNPRLVTIRAGADGIEVSILDPEAMFSVVSSESRAALGVLPAEAKRLLEALIRTLGAAQP